MDGDLLYCLHAFLAFVVSVDILEGVSQAWSWWQQVICDVSSDVYNPTLSLSLCEILRKSIYSTARTATSQKSSNLQLHLLYHSSKSIFFKTYDPDGPDGLFFEVPIRVVLLIDWALLSLVCII